MWNFKHEHILSLIAICLDNDPNFLILELMEGGDLLSYLRTSRPSPVICPVAPVTLLDLVQMCLDVARGCEYLEQLHFVHRDIAARNCLVSSLDSDKRKIKIGDFGLARDIYKNDYYKKEGEGLLPVRWMSPESLSDGVFTNQSGELSTLKAKPVFDDICFRCLELWSFDLGDSDPGCQAVPRQVQLGGAAVCAGRGPAGEAGRRSGAAPRHHGLVLVPGGLGLAGTHHVTS